MAPTWQVLFWFLITLRIAILNALTISSGSPRLWYNLTAVFYPELEQFSYTIHGYFNNRKFLFCDVKREKVDLKSLEKVDIEYLIEKETELKEILWIIGQKSENKERSHTLQVILGCELHVDNSTRGFWNYIYDGQDFLSLSLEDLTWTGASPEAQEVKKTFEQSKSQLTIQAYLLGHCPVDLRNYQRQNPQETETVLPVLHPPDSTPSGSMSAGTNNRVFTGIVTIVSIIILVVVRI
ncbi:H-2 class I histocompatibility antigen, Q9 alpha chain-like [Notamacropus eugenii]|uniref:H-2 class I histocompatibility antigen, Q9 alpha chain-like n=1 Tax=Notamacropus eugenii TaxID=9315 RepID=UPI003B6840A4